MNFFNTIASRLVGGLDVNTLNYINKFHVATTLDASGGSAVIDYNDISYGSTAYGLNTNDENSTFLLVNRGGSFLKTTDFLQNPFKGFSIYLKYKTQDNSLNEVFSPYAVENPVVNLTSSHTEINRGDQLQITVFQNGYADLSYVITGVTSANLNGADLSGTISDLYTVLSYDIQPGIEGGTLVFVAGDASLNISTFPTYFVKTVQNVLGQTVFALKGPGETDFVTQPDLSFNAGDMFMFDVSDPTMNGFSLVFGTSVDSAGSIVTEYVSGSGTELILDIPGDYSGESLVYFEDSSAGMGYVVLSERQEILLYRQTAPTYYTAGLSTLQTQSLNENDPTSSQYSIMNKLYSSTTRSNYEISSGIYRFRCTDSNGYELIVEQENPFDHTDASPNPTVISNSGFVMPSGKDWDFDGWHISHNTTYSIIEGVVGNWGRWNVVHVANSSAWDTVSDKLIAFSSDTNDKLFSDWVEFYAIKNSVSALYAVTVSGDPAVFYIDGSANPQLTFTAGETYVFDQSHTSNIGNQFVLGTVPDLSSSLISYQTVVGTPGQPGAYTTFTATEETVYYFSYETPDMGFAPPTYTVKTDINVLGDTVFSIQKPGDSVYYAQPDLSFGAGFVGLFDVTHIAGSYSLVFGTEVDVSSTIQSQYYSQYSDFIVLSIPSDYSGDSLKYFEDTSAGMGYYVETESLFSYENILTNENSPQSPNAGVSTVTYTVSNSVYSFANGSYTINVTSTSSWGGLVNIIFRDDPYTSGYDWHSDQDYNYTSGVYEGTTTSTDNLGNTYSGEYIQITLPFALKLQVVDMIADRAAPENMVMLGSNDGSTFYYVDEYNNMIATETEIPMISNNYYNVYRMVITKCIGRMINMEFWNIRGFVTESINPTYVVTVSGDPAVFYIDDVSKPQLTFTAGDTYIFDQSHSSNTGHTLVIGTTADNSGSLVSYQTVVGTPGQAGAYTSFTATEETVFYFSYETPDMGFAPPPPTSLANFSQLALDNNFTLPQADFITYLSGYGWSLHVTNSTGGAPQYGYQNIWNHQDFRLPGYKFYNPDSLSNYPELDASQYKYTVGFPMFGGAPDILWISKTYTTAKRVYIYYGSSAYPENVNADSATNIYLNSILIDSTYVDESNKSEVYRIAIIDVSTNDELKVWEALNGIILYAIEEYDP
jgi:hypothetical protein